MNNIDIMSDAMKNNGFYLLKDFLPINRCKYAINELNNIQELRFKKNEFIGNSGNQVLYNYFIENKEFLSFIYNDTIFNMI